MNWKFWKKKEPVAAAAPVEPEKKEERGVPLDEFFKDREGHFTGAGHPSNYRGVHSIPAGWPYPNGYTVIPDDMYPVIRVDGHAFHTFTRKLHKPFDQNMQKAMCMATKKLVEFFSAAYGYTQSDEITIVLPYKSQDYGRKTHKLASLAAAVATAEFIKWLEFYSEKKLEKLPVFDGRAFAIENTELLGYYQIWRQHDAMRNAISAVARSLFSHKQLEGKNSDDKVAMMKEKGVDFWEKYSTDEIFGFYFKRKVFQRKFTPEEIEKLPERHEARKNPDLMVTRAEILKIDFHADSRKDLGEQMLALITKEELCGLAHAPEGNETPNEATNTGDEI